MHVCVRLHGLFTGSGRLNALCRGWCDGERSFTGTVNVNTVNTCVQRVTVNRVNKV